MTRLAFDQGGGRILAGIWGDRQHGGVLVGARRARPLDPARRGPGGPRGAVARRRAARTCWPARTTGCSSWTPATGAWTRLPDGGGPASRSTRASTTWRSRCRTRRGCSRPSRGLLRTADGGRHLAAHRDRPARAAVDALAVSPREPAAGAGGHRARLLPQRRRRTRPGRPSGGTPGRAPTRTACCSSRPNDRVAFAATSRGLFRSVDAARTGRGIAGGVPFTDITGLASDSRRPHALRQRLRRRAASSSSADGGESWRRLSVDGLVTERVWSLAVDPRAPDRVFAATPSGGLHVLHQAAATTRPEDPRSDRPAPGHCQGTDTPIAVPRPAHARGPGGGSHDAPRTSLRRSPSLPECRTRPRRRRHSPRRSTPAPRRRRSTKASPLFRRKRFAVAASTSSGGGRRTPTTPPATFYLAYTVYKIAEPKRPFHPEKQQAAQLFDKAYELDPNFKPVWAPRK